MSNRAVIATQSAPQAIGPYSQGIKAGNTVWISGQIPLDPTSMTLVAGDIATQADQVFSNLAAIAEAAGATLNNAVKVNISLTDLSDFDAVNTVMASHFEAPYPARACVQVGALPKGADIEVEAILVLQQREPLAQFRMAQCVERGFIALSPGGISEREPDLIQ